MKKLLSLIMVMCLSVSLFAGCGGEETSSDATKAPSASAPASAPATAPATATAKPTEEATTTPSTEPTAAPTTKPAEKEDPEVDAILYRFYDADKYMWASDNFITPDDLAQGFGQGKPDVGTYVSCEYYYDDTEEALAIHILDFDPYFMIKTAEGGETFDLSQYPVFKIRLKNETNIEKFDAFICKAPSAAGPDNFQFELSGGDEEYQEYYFDFVKEKGQEFVDERTTVEGFRLDALAISPEGFANIEPESAYLYVEYFGFFKTLEDAQNWNPAHVA
ncbi:MAG: hypothetical protein E7387_03450 [Ruminococcaceae bacterium]|nr:hypothetical protein [Oscillospiraceae bacterium]